MRNFTEMLIFTDVCEKKQGLSNSFRIGNGLRQGDSLACILFNIVLEKIIREANINQRGNIFYTSVQILGYADNIDIISR